MPRRLLYALGAVLFLVTVALIVWQSSFSGSFFFAPDDADQTFVLYGISILIFLVFVYLGFMLVRLIWKLWIERASDRVGSRIKIKLVVGALLLSVMPVFFMVLFSVNVLNNSIRKWFNLPAEHELVDLDRIAKALDRQTFEKAEAEAELLAALPETRLLLSGSTTNTAWLAPFCLGHGILAASIDLPGTGKSVAAFGSFPRPGASAKTVSAPVISPNGPRQRAVNHGSVRLALAIPIDMAKQERAIEDYHRTFGELRAQQRAIRRNYLLLLTVIAFFIFFVASWLAHYLARQISGPISAVLDAIEQVGRGNLGCRVNVIAMDELAQLVSGFNRMTGDLEANRSEIEARRRFTEAILESIPTGVISVDSAGAVQLINKALEEIFSDSHLPHLRLSNSHSEKPVRLEDLFAREDAAEIRYLMNRARRTTHATQQLEIKTPSRTLHLAITVSAIEGAGNSGFVIVIEDTSDLLRAQKTAAWSEVARRVAHEIRNPLTPITLSAERIIRQLNRQPEAVPPAMQKVVRECAETILDETASVKRLVDEFWEFSRLPAAKPKICELNDVVASGLAVFADRLQGIEIHVDLAPGMPQVSIDPEQFKRVVVNLIDNAAEAMQDSPAKLLTVRTRAGISGDTVELTVADTGCGITREQKEKLFLPYFSTKGRGTGLGLAIVSHILAEHSATIRVEDNRPCGAWFTVEVPAATADGLIAPPAAAAVV